MAKLIDDNMYNKLESFLMLEKKFKKRTGIDFDEFVDLLVTDHDVTFTQVYENTYKIKTEKSNKNFRKIDKRFMI